MWNKIENKTEWNKIINAQKNTYFFQSYEWGEFQKSLSREVKYFSWDNKIFILVIKMNLLKDFFYWYIPRGPIVIDKSVDIKFAMSELLKELRKSGALFLRTDPISTTNFSFDKKKRFVASTQPQCTRILDLSKDENRILSDMHQKTRYNIRLAQKKEVKIYEGSVEDFIELNKQTTKRDKFVSHPDFYYQKMFQSLPKEFIKVWSAKYQGKVLASAIILYFGNTATYVHGASSDEHREVMAPYFLHWKIIQDAKLRKYQKYDFFGVNPKDEKHQAYKKSWQGISRFKSGFSGKLICYPQSFDLIYRKAWYSVYRLIKKLKKYF